MKHLLSYLICGFSALFGFAAWLAIQIEPDRYVSVPAVPTPPAAIETVAIDETVAAVAANPAVVSGASIHHDLAGIVAG